jgi:peptide/nickel transport system substrate-binding protein
MFRLFERLTWLAGGVLAMAGAGPAMSQETPKHGGTLTYMIPADAPPSLDGHRETTFATVHATAPFYSVLIRINPANPIATNDFACDVCTEMPVATEGGKTWTFTIRDGVRFQDGTPLTAFDVAASWQELIAPRAGVTSARVTYFAMVESVKAPDNRTVVFRLKFPTATFLPALADPYAYIYKKEILDRDPRWYETHILGSGPFRFTEYETGQSISGVRNPDYYHKGLPYLDGFRAIFADKQSVRIDAMRADRASAEFRGIPPAARDQLVKELGDKITTQSSDWNCTNMITPNHSRKPFDDVRVRRALGLAIDQWNGAPALSRIANIKTVGGVVFPGSPLAATKEELQKMSGYWPDIEKSRAEARRLLKEAGQEGLRFELLNRNVDQPYKYVGTWVIDEWTKIGVHATQRVLPTGPWYDALRSGAFDVTVEANCQGLVNPVLDVGKLLPRSVYTENYGFFEDQKLVDLYQVMLFEPDPAKLRVLMREFETYALDTQVHALVLPWWARIVPARSYMKGWKISPSHYVGQDLATVWLDR